MADGASPSSSSPPRSCCWRAAAGVVLRTADGDLTVLDGHTPLVGAVVPGDGAGSTRRGRAVNLAVHGGFVQVDTARRGRGWPRAPAERAVDPGHPAGRRGRAGREIDVARAEAGQGGRRGSELAVGRAAGPPDGSEGASSSVGGRAATLARAELGAGPTLERPWSAAARAPAEDLGRSGERDRAVLGQLGQRVHGVDLAHRPRLATA